MDTVLKEFHVSNNEELKSELMKNGFSNKESKNIVWYISEFVVFDNMEGLQITPDLDNGGWFVTFYK